MWSFSGKSDTFTPVYKHCGSSIRTPLLVPLLVLTMNSDRMSTATLFVDRSTVEGEWLCGNRSFSAGNDSPTAGDCRRRSGDQSSTWSDASDEVGELFKNIILGLVLVAVCLLTVVGNALVLHAVRTERKLQTVKLTSTASKYNLPLCDSNYKCCSKRM